jgi:hypothetical protein
MDDVTGEPEKEIGRNPQIQSELIGKSVPLELTEGESPIRGDMPFSAVMDVDFSFLHQLSFRDRIPALAQFLLRYRTSPVPAAMALFLLDIDDEIMEEEGEKGENVIAKEEFIDQYLPTTKNWSPQKVSEHKKAGKAAFRFRRELDAAGVDIFTTRVIKKLYHLEDAITRYREKAIVFENFALMKKGKFIAWANGENFVVKNGFSRLEAYFHVCAEQKSLFRD